LCAAWARVGPLASRLAKAVASWINALS
jgi:hypothetical protein